MIERGELTAEEGARMKKLFEDYERHYRRTMAPDAAASEASVRTLKELTADAALKRRRELGAIAQRGRALEDLKTYRGKSTFGGIRAMLANDPNAPYENVDLAMQRIENDANSRIADFITRHHRDFAGQPRDKAGLLDMVREAHGDSTGNARAGANNHAIQDVFEDLRLRYNAAGGAVGKLDNYFPHKWSTQKVRNLGWVDGDYDPKVGYQEYRAIVMPELDVMRMRDPLTGGELTAERLDETLRAAYQNTRSGGLMGEASAAFRGAGALANRRDAERFLHFKSADGWLRVHEALGEGDPFSAVTDHIRGMARDIALMERFGYNPDSTMRFLIDHAEREEAQGGTRMSAAALHMSGGRLWTENLYRYTKGELNVPIVPEGWTQGPPVELARAVAGTRNILSSALLGSATISAATGDVMTNMMARKFNGLPEVKAVMSYLKQLNPASSRDRKLAVYLGLGMRDATRSLTGMSRYYGDLNKAGWTAVVADDVLRLSLLNKVTEAGQKAFGLDFLGTLGERRGLTWDQMGKRQFGKAYSLQETMARYGIDENMWNSIRSSEPVRSGGVDYIHAQNVADPRAAERLMQMVLGETQAAVIETTPQVRAGVAMLGRPGTWQREITANSLQFKGYTFSMMQLWGERMAQLPFWNRARFFAQFFTAMTVAGAVSLQIREMLKSRDMRPMVDENGAPDPYFWKDAALQGGGLGILGDLTGALTRDPLRENGWAEFVAGPFGSAVGDLARAGATAVPHKLSDGDWSTGNPGKAAVQLAGRYVPGGNLWYTRTAFQHFVLDELSQAIDPTYLESQQRVQQWAADNHQGLWWQPGPALPHRGPNVANAAGPQYALPQGE
jgi:hypothetical protein